MCRRHLLYLGSTVLGLSWSGFFLHVAYRRLLRFSDLVFAASPFYPKEYAALIGTPAAMSDWQSPLCLAGAPLALFLIWRVRRWVRSNSKNMRA